MNSNKILNLTSGLESLEYITHTQVESFYKLGVSSIYDLISYYPKQYIDLKDVVDIQNAVLNYRWTILGDIYDIKIKAIKSHQNIIEVSIIDNTSILIATFFDADYFLENYKKNNRVVLCGKVEFNFGFKRMINPQIYQLEDRHVSKDKHSMLPVYKSLASLTSSKIQNIIFKTLGLLDKELHVLPKKLITRYKLLDFVSSLKCIHFPKSIEDVKQAKRTLKFIEVLLWELDFISKSKVNSCDNKVDFIINNYHKSKINKQNKKTCTVLDKSQNCKVYDCLYEYLERGKQIIIYCPLNGLSTRVRDEIYLKHFTCLKDLNLDDDKLLYYGGLYRISIDNDEDWNNIRNDKFYSYLNFLKNKTFQNYTVELLSNNIPIKNEQKVMHDFNAGNIDILVTTKLIYGDLFKGDIACIIVNDADRFGLAQLYKLQKSYDHIQIKTFLLSNSKNKDSISRLEYLNKCNTLGDAYLQDIRFRGAGEVMLYKNLASLKLIDFNTDTNIITCAKKEAINLINEDPKLTKCENKQLKLLMSILNISK